MQTPSLSFFSAAEANTERVLQVEPTAAPTPHMMMPSHSDHDSHDSHDSHDDETASPTTPDDVSAEGDGAAALGGAKTLVAAVGCALAAVGGALSVL